MEDRKAAILQAVIEQYIATAQPVGSSAVARRAGIGVSPATVRNEMMALEREGYLDQPHTSAGRVPTDKGYRFYVDALEEPGAPPSRTRQQVRAFFDRAHGELEEMLRDTSQLLSNLTHYAGVVIGPPAESAVVRSVQLVGLSPRAALLVLVLSNGSVEKHTVEHAETDAARVAAAGAHLAAAFDGASRARLPAVGAVDDEVIDALVRAAVDAMTAVHDGEEDVYVGGAARMAEAFDAVETVRNVLSILEQQLVVVTLLRDVLSRGEHVSIGAEHGIDSLAECSLVVAPYVVAGEPAGTIGVLGPTRMDYGEAMATVAVVSHRLGKRLTEG